MHDEVVESCAGVLIMHKRCRIFDFCYLLTCLCVSTAQIYCSLRAGLSYLADLEHPACTWLCGKYWQGACEIYITAFLQSKYLVLQEIKTN